MSPVTRTLKFLQSILARYGVLVYRQQLLPYGVDPAFDIKRLFGGARCIVDVGANVGQSATYYAKAFGDATVYSFEPVGSTFAQLKANTRGEKRIRCFEQGLGAHEHEATIRLTCPTQSSLLNAASDGDSRENTATVSITTGDAWAAAQGVGSIDLLKIDTEGYDLEVLKGFAGMLSRGKIKAVLVECEFDRVTVEPHGNFFELYRLLTGYGMRIVTFYTDSATPRGMAWGNALFAVVAGAKAASKHDGEAIQAGAQAVGGGVGQSR
jgi:FkbM family methyltransferase